MDLNENLSARFSIVRAWPDRYRRALHSDVPSAFLFFLSLSFLRRHGENDASPRLSSFRNGATRRSRFQRTKQNKGKRLIDRRFFV